MNKICLKTNRNISKIDLIILGAIRVFIIFKIDLMAIYESILSFFKIQEKKSDESNRQNNKFFYVIMLAKNYNVFAMQNLKNSVLVF